MKSIKKIAIMVMILGILVIITNLGTLLSLRGISIPYSVFYNIIIVQVALGGLIIVMGMETYLQMRN